VFAEEDDDRDDDDEMENESPDEFEEASFISWVGFFLVFFSFLSFDLFTLL